MQPWKGNIPAKLFHAHENIKRRKRERKKWRKKDKEKEAGCDEVKASSKILTDLQQEQELLRKQTRQRGGVFFHPSIQPRQKRDFCRGPYIDMHGL